MNVETYLKGFLNSEVLTVAARNTRPSSDTRWPTPARPSCTGSSAAPSLIRTQQPESSCHATSSSIWRKGWSWNGHRPSSATCFSRSTRWRPPTSWPWQSCESLRTLGWFYGLMRFQLVPSNKIWLFDYDLTAAGNTWAPRRSSYQVKNPNGLLFKILICP